MLQSEDLSREGFEDIFKGAKEEAVKLCPEWTNHNTSDPGITLLELMSWLAEVQRYHLNSINERHFLRYLKLHGKPPRCSVPAKTYLKLSGGGFAPKGSVFYADEIPFETEYGCSADDNVILSLGSGTDFVANKNDIFLHSLHSFTNTLVYPFGRGLPYQSFRISLKNPVPANSVLGIYFAVRLCEPCAEINNKEDCIVSVRAYVGRSSAEILLDETMGFTKSGVIMLRTSEEKSSEIHFAAESGEFAAMPVITGAVVNVVPAFQKRTLSRIVRFDNVRDGKIRTALVPKLLFALDGETGTLLDNFNSDGKNIITGNTAQSYEAVFYDHGFEELCYLGEATGLCDFRVKSRIDNLLENSPQLYVSENGIFFKWQLVRDFDSANKYSRCYTYDAQADEFVFGNGEKGMPPRGYIYLFSCAVSLKSGGNIKAGMVNSTNEQGISAVNILPSEGGAERQSIDECYNEVKASMGISKCCVTLADYENAVRNTPGMPQKHIKAYVSELRENCVCIALESFIEQTAQNSGLMRNLRRNILPKVQLGTKVEFPAVRYAPVNIYIGISADIYSSDSKELTENAIRGFFDSDRVNFGGILSVNELSRYVYELSWVSAVRSVDLSVSASDGERLPSGDIKLKNVCLPRVGRISVTLEH